MPGIPLLVSWFLGFWCLVFWFLGFLVSRFLGFLVSKIISFLVSKFQRFNETILPNFRFMFLIDVDLIPKIYKIVLGGSSSLFGARLFQNLQNVGFPTFRDL